MRCTVRSGAACACAAARVQLGLIAKHSTCLRLNKTLSGARAQAEVQAAVGALGEAAEATAALHRALEQQALAQLGLQDDIRRALDLGPKTLP